MSNKNTMLLFSISLIGVFFLECEFTNSVQHTLPQKAILTLDEKLFSLSYNQFDINRETNHYWGYAKVQEKIEPSSTDANSTKELKVTKKDGQNLLCISSSCYRLIGIHHEKRSSTVTLYNKDLEEKVKAYATKEILQDNILVKQIATHSILFSEVNSTREWKFKIFDVNATQYKPKEEQL